MLANHNSAADSWCKLICYIYYDYFVFNNANPFAVTMGMVFFASLYGITLLTYGRVGRHSSIMGDIRSNS